MKYGKQHTDGSRSGGQKPEQQQASAGEVPETVPVSVAVVRFLRGMAALDGKWFGEHKEGQGAFWWRKHLPDPASATADPNRRTSPDSVWPALADGAAQDALVAVQQEGQMMASMTPLPPDAPAMVAWATFKDSEEYQNTRKWALDSNHVDGSLWAAFLRGHMAALAAKEAELAAVKAERDALEPDSIAARQMREIAQELGYPSILEALEDLDDMKAREAKLRACLGFFASVIKSGEPWTATCEQRYRAALSEQQT